LPEAQAQQLAADIQAFQVEFPHYHVQLQHYDSPETFMTPLMAGQFNFDVVLASPPLLGNLWTAKRIAPMADFFPPSFIDGFAAVTLAGATRDGQVWGLPDTTGFHLLLFYNEDLVDAPPTNTRQLAELAENLTQEARWGLGVNSYDPLWLVPWLTPFGGELTDETGHPTLDTPAMIEALSLFASWQTGSPAIAPIQTYDEMRARFLSGNIAMLIDGDWSIGELEQVGRVEWGVAPLPTISESQDGQPAAPLVLGRYWAISPAAAAGDRALAAAAFLEFMTRPERQLAWTRQFGLLPTHREALGAPLIINDPVLRTSAAQMQAGRPMLLGVNTNRLLDAMREPLQGVINGELTPEEAAELMQANAEQP
jgi:ABC-type glycerol-3-phosphate transport system substrate-binding protein